MCLSSRPVPTLPHNDGAGPGEEDNKKMRYEIIGQLRNKVTGEVLCQISAFDLESFEEELSKIGATIQRYEDMYDEMIGKGNELVEKAIRASLSL